MLDTTQMFQYEHNSVVIAVYIKEALHLHNPMSPEKIHFVIFIHINIDIMLSLSIGN